jgi:iron complex outermembrane receptor protein
MSIEELASLEVTSVSKRAESQREAAAAVYVITQEDIRRSGATTIVEALRLAPGVEVGRIRSSQWAVGIRGFASRTSRSVLVLIDGRSVYTPLFAGVYWEAQDTVLADVERIEVIRGPGGALWGANAVNGVISIITKSAEETLGGHASAGSGDEEHAVVAARYGGRLGNGTFYRVYGKYADREAQFHSDGQDVDAWHMAQGGFRTDGALGALGTLTVQGDAYTSRNGILANFTSFTPPFQVTAPAEVDISGGNLLGRLTHATKAGSEIRLQVYFDRTHRHEPQVQEDRNTLDFDLQGHYSPASRHDVTWGLAYRWTADDTGRNPTVFFVPQRRTDRLFSALLQDQIAASDRLRFTLGTKLEHNGYSGFEVQPNLRVAYRPAGDHVLWAAASRAVRTPSRLDHDITVFSGTSPTVPVFAVITGNERFVAEQVLAYEAGYRLQATPRLSFDLSAFYDRYRDLFSLEANAPFQEGGRVVVPFTVGNGIRGRGRGFELATDAIVTTILKVRTSYSYLALDLAPKRGSSDTSTAHSTEGSSPRHQVATAGYLDLPRNFELDAMARYVDRIPAQRIEAYFNLDLRLAWRPIRSLELSILGQGLLQDHHAEFDSVEIERAILGHASWRF